MFTKWLTGVSLTRNPKNRAALIGMLCMTIVFSAGCSFLPKEDVEEALPTINPPKLSQKPSYTVKTDTLVTKVRGSGKLMSQKEENVYFADDNKRIKDVYVKTGDYVEQGQLIAELDASEEESELRQLRLQTRSDEIKLIEILRGTGDKTAEQLEQARIDFEIKKEVIAKKAESVAKTKITAPFSGTVVSLNVRKGDMSKANDNVATIADLSQLTVAAAISADDLKKVAIGMEVEVDINTLGKFNGKVSQLPNPNSSSYGQAGGDNNVGGYYSSGSEQARDSIDKYVLVELEEMPENANRGIPLSIAVIVQKKENAIVIPLSALRSVSGRNYVQVVDDKGNKREVDVEIGQQTSTDVEILKGLTPGQKVVGR